MVDDLRKDHDPRPSAEERGWMSVNFFGALARFVAVAGLAVTIGLGASVMLERYVFTPTMASVR